MKRNEKAIIAEIKTAAKKGRELAALYKSIAAKLQTIDGTRWTGDGESLSDAQVYRNLADTFIRRCVAKANKAAFQTKNSAALLARIPMLLNEREEFAKEIGVVL